MIKGLSHLTFVVSDLDRTARLITEVLGGQEIYDSGEDHFSISCEKFFDVNGMWIAIMEGDPLYERTYNHVAFQIDEADLPKARAAIEQLGLDIREPRPRVEGEGQSLYFHDYDNHLFELHTGSLQSRLNTYKMAAE